MQATPAKLPWARQIRHISVSPTGQFAAAVDTAGKLYTFGAGVFSSLAVIKGAPIGLGSIHCSASQVVSVAGKAGSIRGALAVKQQTCCGPGSSDVCDTWTSRCGCFVCVLAGKWGQLGHGDTSKRTVGRLVKQLRHLDVLQVGGSI